jgi:predicted TIM-barrel fold metal-dependent hydrolase
MKVDLQLLAPQDRAMRFNYSVEKNLAAEMAHSYNLTVKNLVDQYPDKFFGAALLPMQDIDLALKELHWAIENNFKIIYIDNAMFNNESGHENVWSTIRSQMDKIYKVCEENKIVIYMHFLMTHNVPYVIPEKIKHMNSLANMDGTMRRLEVSLCDLLSDDIFDHYPDLQIVITEAMQRRFGKVLKILNDSYNLEPGLFKGKKHFINYIKENLFFTVDIEMKDSFNMLLKYAGSNRLLFSTDYPHDDPSGVNKWNDVRDLYASGLPQEDLENIAYRNAEKLFRL